MQLLLYIRYFIFLASKWDMQIAWHILLEEIKGERKYGLHSTGFDDLKTLSENGTDTSHATIYMPASYDILETCFSFLQEYKLKHLVDLGCGKGRAMAVAAHFGFNKITGVEFSEKLADEAKKNLSSTGKKIPSLQWEVIIQNVRHYEIPADSDCIFLFNPFDQVVLGNVLDNIESSIQNNPRSMYVIYLTPNYRQLFDSSGYKVIKQIRIMEYLDAVIYNKGFAV